MPSPFPGMNPYIEQDDAWHDFHERFLPLAAERIGAQVFPDYLVKIDEHVCIHENPDEPRRLLGRADVAVSRPEPHVSGRSAGVIAAPARLRVPTVDIERLAFLEIRDRKSRALITVVELLSPANKRPGPDREQYLTKRNVVLTSPVHLVEIDLLRGGVAMPADERPPCDYAVMVSRAQDRLNAGFWPIWLRERLPVIPIPLRGDDSAAELDLQELLGRIYDTAGYALFIYGGAPDPPLAPDDAAWAHQIVPAAKGPS